MTNETAVYCQPDCKIIIITVNVKFILTFAIINADNIKITSVIELKLTIPKSLNCQ